MERHNFFFFLSLSFGIHVFLVIFLFVSNDLWGFFKKDKIFVPSSIRVEVVGLPDSPSKTKAVPKKAEKPVLIPEKENRRKKQVQNKKGTKKKKKPDKKKPTEKKENQSPVSDSKQKLNKGNQLAEGAEEGGQDLSPQKMFVLNTYLSTVDVKVKENWNLPKYLTEINLTAQIEIKINDEGKIIYKRIIVSSRNDLFDSYVLKAMENAAPYPAPPAEIKNLLKGGVVLILSSKN